MAAAAGVGHLAKACYRFVVCVRQNREIAIAILLDDRIILHRSGLATLATIIVTHHSSGGAVGGIGMPTPFVEFSVPRLRVRYRGFASVVVNDL
jgi:hypothetical protein